MRRVVVAAVSVCMLALDASAQTALAPWFDADGFYNRPGVELDRATADLTACRAEAARLKVVRNTHTSVGTASAFNANGSYNPAVSGAATGIASILFAIQDARYNGGIEQTEFRDCAAAIGYRYYGLGQRDRVRFNQTPDRGFAALVSAATPAEGRLNQGETQRNYYAADLVPGAYQNAPPLAAPTSPAAPAEVATAEPAPAEPQQPAATGVIERVQAGVTVSAEPHSAIVVVSARQLADSMHVPMAGETFRFRRVSAEGRLVDLVGPTASFALRSHFNPDRRRDATLSGAFDAPRYSTYVIPAGRYVLSDLGTLNACLGTLTFEVRGGDVVYLGDFALHTQGIPVGALFNPVANINSSMDNRLRADLRVAIGDDLEAARAALQADDAAKAQLTHVSYANGFRIPCDGRYIGRVANEAWPVFDGAQMSRFHDDMAAAVAAAQ